MKKWVGALLIFLVVGAIVMYFSLLLVDGKSSVHSAQNIQATTKAVSTIQNQVDVNVWDDAKQLAKTGKLYDGEWIAFGSSKTDVRKYQGKPLSEQKNMLDYGNMSFLFDEQQKLASLTFIRTDEFPINVSLTELKAAFGPRIALASVVDTMYYTYQVNQRMVSVALDSKSHVVKQITISK